MTILDLDCRANRSNGPRRPIGEPTPPSIANLNRLGSSFQVQVIIGRPLGRRDSATMINISAGS